MDNYYKEEVERVHQYLDDLKIPRIWGLENYTLSLIGRIKRLEERFIREASEVESHYLKLLEIK